MKTHQQTHLKFKSKMRKKAITFLAILVVTASFAQAKNINGTINKSDKKVHVSDMKIHVTIDAIEDVETKFKKQDIEKLFTDLGEIEDIVFKLTCNNQKEESGVKSSVSYEVKGSSKDKDLFLEQVELIKRAAIKYYKNEK